MDSETTEDKQGVSTFMKWLFVTWMSLATLFFVCQIIHNFNKLSLIGKTTPDKARTFIDSLYKSISSSKSSQLIDSTKKANTQNNDSTKLKKDSALFQTLLKNAKNYLTAADEKDADEKNNQHLILLLVAYCGGLGSLIFILSSFVDFWGNRKLERSWLAWYVAKPFVGMGLAVVTYFVFRGGFLTASSSSGDINTYGLLTFACLVGLFSDDATLKLKEVFAVIFHPKDERGGTLLSSPITIFSLAPKEVKVGVETDISIAGQNFPIDFSIKYNDNLLVTTNIISSDKNLIRFKLPAITADVKSVKISIHTTKENKDYDSGTITVTP